MDSWEGEWVEAPGDITIDHIHSGTGGGEYAWMGGGKRLGGGKQKAEWGAQIAVESTKEWGKKGEQAVLTPKKKELQPS